MSTRAVNFFYSYSDKFRVRDQSRRLLERRRQLQAGRARWETSPRESWGSLEAQYRATHSWGEDYIAEELLLGEEGGRR